MVEAPGKALERALARKQAADEAARAVSADIHATVEQGRQESNGGADRQ